MYTMRLKKRDTICKKKWDFKIKVMELTVSLVMQSHLSDAMIEMDFNPEQANHRLRFVKYLINMFPSTDKKVDIDEVYKQFKLRDK